MIFLRNPTPALLNRAIEGKGPHSNPRLGLLNKAYYKTEKAAEAATLPECLEQLAEAQKALRELARVLTHTPELSEASK